MNLLRSFAAVIIYGVLLLFTYAIHARYFPVNVVFYSALLDAVIAALALALVLVGVKLFRNFNGNEKVLTFAICLLCGYIFAISVPTVLDRSLSFYILEKLQQRGGGILKDRFAEVFTLEYVVEHRLVDVRLTEQMESGTISIDGGCVRLTPRGERLATFSRYFRQHFLPKHRLLMGAYSDDLTDPFKKSAGQRGYECH